MRKAAVVVLTCLSAMLLNVGAHPGDRSKDVEVLPKAAGREAEFFYGGVSPLDFLSGFNEMIERMRQQMARVLALGPGRIAPGDGNTTSVTKVIDGHKYTINETVYGGGDGEAGAIFKVRILDIRPAAETEGGATREDSLENDVNRVEPLSVEKKRETYDGLETMDAFENLSGEMLDLSNDIYVNELAARDVNRRPHPDFEWIDELHNDLVVNDLGNDIRVNELAARDVNRRPHPDAEWIHDLHNDLFVNEVAAAQGWTPHPDSETIDFDNELPPPGARFRYANDR